MLKRSLPEMPKKKILLALGIILVIVAVGISQPILWPGGFGIGKEQSVTTTSIETVVKDAQGNTTKTVETTKNDDGKTLWDWLSLLGVPLSLAVLGYILQQLQQKRAESLAKEEVLQVYFDRLSALLVDKNLLAIAARINPKISEETEGQPQNNATVEELELLDSAVVIIRATTLSILRRFENDPKSKAIVIQFLSEADILSKLRLNLSGANLSHTNLSETNLYLANLKNTDLRGADLRGAWLVGANLSYANLSNAILSDSNLSNAILDNADLSNAILNKARLIGAHLYKVNLSGADISEALLLGAKIVFANLSSTNLSNTLFQDAHLMGVNLKNANLKTVIFGGATLRSVDFSTTSNLTVDALLCAAKLSGITLPTGMALDPNHDCEVSETDEIDPADLEIDTEDYNPYI